MTHYGQWASDWFGDYKKCYPNDPEWQAMFEGRCNHGLFGPSGLLFPNELTQIPDGHWDVLCLEALYGASSNRSGAWWNMGELVGSEPTGTGNEGSNLPRLIAGRDNAVRRPRSRCGQCGHH